MHDLGKAQAKWQEYLAKASSLNRQNAHLEDVENAKPIKIPHSTAGAKYAIGQLDPVIGAMLAYLIAGHHAGLADWYGGLKNRLNYTDANQELDDSLIPFKNNQLPQSLLKLDEDKLFENIPVFLTENFSTELHVWLRFLFSCLVDADFLDTEAFMNGYPNADIAKTNELRPTFPDLHASHQRYEIFMADLAQKADKNLKTNQIRHQVLERCFVAAELEHSLFSLTVPTGGGKTLASLGFALKHAIKFHKKRIIYAIPFTSIIEQNADVFRKVFGKDVVLEHHSNLDVAEKDENAKNRLATENWDAPLIVTTNVQLFESLFASRTSRCRKIHNIADSVIILDEVQQLPQEFQKPITEMMRVLAKDYGVTFVLCTATQPKLDKETDAFGRVLMEGLNDVHEIIDNPNALADSLRRVGFKLPQKDSSSQSWQEIADEIREQDCVLAIVNIRKHARSLFNALPKHGVKLHLSANMCATHRSETIALIRFILTQKQAGQFHEPLWVVSTQLIEAGVDLDFPVVYRAMAGLDSIAQAAGRCNREGRLDEGKVVVFRAEQGAPSGSLKQGQDITEEMLAGDLLSDPLSPTTFRDYFARFNAKGERDKHSICEKLTVQSNTDNPVAIKFRTAAENFRLIDNKGLAVIVPHRPLKWEKTEGVQIHDFFKRVLLDKSSEVLQDVLKSHQDNTSHPAQGCELKTMIFFTRNANKYWGFYVWH